MIVLARRTTEILHPELHGINVLAAFVRMLRAGGWRVQEVIDTRDGRTLVLARRERGT